MRVLMITPEYPPKVMGSAGWTIHRLVHELARRGVEIYVVCPSDYEEQRAEDSVKVVTAFCPIRTQLHVITWAWSLIVSLVRRGAEVLHSLRGKIDLIHAQEWIGLVAASYLKWYSKVPLVATLHSTEAMRGGRTSLISECIYGIERYFISEADIVAASSKDEAESLIRDYGVEPSRIVLIDIERVNTLIDLYRKVSTR